VIGGLIGVEARAKQVIPPRVAGDDKLVAVGVGWTSAAASAAGRGLLTNTPVSPVGRSTRK